MRVFEPRKDRHRLRIVRIAAGGRIDRNPRRFGAAVHRPQRGHEIVNFQFGDPGYLLAKQDDLPANGIDERTRNARELREKLGGLGQEDTATVEGCLGI
jgi:hypothetical protein